MLLCESILREPSLLSTTHEAWSPSNTFKHSPNFYRICRAAVRCCFISAGPDPGTLFYPLPHMGGKAFIPAQPDQNGKTLWLPKTKKFAAVFCSHAAQVKVAVGHGMILGFYWKCLHGRSFLKLFPGNLVRLRLVF